MRNLRRPIKESAHPSLPPRTMDIEDALKRAGHFGILQKRAVFLVAIFQLVSSINVLVITFAGMTPNWHCYEESKPNHLLNLTYDERCHMYDSNAGNCTPVYDEGFYSVTKEWNLICKKSNLINLSQSGFFLGFLVGAYVLGGLADSVGRKKVILIYLIGFTILPVLTAISTNFYLFSLLRLAMGFVVSGGIPFFVLISEILGSSYRGLLSVLISAFFGIGFVTLSLAAYLLGEWRSLVFLAAILTVPFLFLYKYFPESPRWLLSIGNVKEAEQVIKYIARTNKCTLPSDFTLYNDVKENGGSSVGLVDLLRHNIMCKRTLLIMCSWFTICMVYYGLSLGVGNLSDNIYISLSLSGLVEIPSNLLTYFIMDRLGRRLCNSGFLFLSGIASIGCAIVQFSEIDYSGIQVLLSLIGKFFVSAAFCVIYTYTAELFSTDVRNLGMGIANVSARLGGIIAPVVILLDNIMPGLSMMAMGSLAFITSILCLGLPETLNTPLLNTINEVT